MATTKPKTTAKKDTPNPNIYVEGIAFYAKLNKPQDAYKPRDPKEWVIDLVLTDEGLATAAKGGVKFEDGTSVNEKTGELTSKAKSVQKYKDEIAKLLALPKEEFTALYAGGENMSDDVYEELRTKLATASSGHFIRATRKQRDEKSTAPKIYANGADGGLVQIPNDRIQIGNGSRVTVGLLPVTLGTEKTFGEYNVVLSTVNIKDLVVYTKSPKTGKSSFVFGDDAPPFEVEEGDTDEGDVGEVDIYKQA